MSLTLQVITAEYGDLEKFFATKKTLDQNFPISGTVTQVFLLKKLYENN